QAIFNAESSPNSANSNPATSIPDQIMFAIPGSGPFLIHLLTPLTTLNPINVVTPLTPLYPINDQVDINGYSENAFLAGNPPPTFRDQTVPGAPLIQIDGSGIDPSVYPNADGLDIAQVNCWIGGLIITGFRGAGINLLPAPAVDQGSIGDVL